MRNCNDNTISILCIVHAVELHAILTHCITFTCPRINNYRGNAISLQSLDDIIHLAITSIRAVFFERQSKNYNLGLLRGLACLNHLLNCGICNVGTHAVIHNTSVQNNLAVIAQLLCLISKVVWVNTNAVAANQTRTESQSIPLSVHPIDNFVSVNAHTIKHHRQLIHESDINITLTVLNNLYRFGRLDVRNRICTNFNY